VPRRPTRAWRLLALLLFAGGCVTAAEAPAPIPSSQELEAQGAVIGEISIAVGDIFDPTVDGEDGWLYRTANKLHINTKPSVIRRQLLFESGDPYSHRLIQETERILREQDFLYDAVIVPTAYDGKIVDLEVRTRDVWTLNPGLSFSRKGGENAYGVQLAEDNLLGSGQSLEFEWDKNVDRTSLGVTYFDPNFLRAFNRFTIGYADADDGDTKLLAFNRPFYALDVRRAGGASLFDNERIDYRYELGKKVGEFGHRDEYYEAYHGRSRGLQEGWARRWTYGVSYERDRFEPEPDKPLAGPLPPDRKLVYPWIGFELVEDGYQERVNQDQIHRTEDVLVGLRAAVRVGVSSEAFGADDDAIVASATLKDGTDLRPGLSVFGSMLASGRFQGGSLENGMLGADGRLYWTTSKKSKFYAAVSGAVTERLDEELQLTLGGHNGLRGYPLRYQAGTSRALLTLEERFYTNWYPFRLFHVGAAAFFDMGRTWGTDVTGAESLGLLKDVGVGLRFGSSRSSFGNVLHVDVAFPLDGDDDIDSVQLLVTTKGSF
jgi:outer membrane protein assembly factor BamA